MSTRFVPHIALLAILTGAVVWTAWLSPRRADPCAQPNALPVTGLIPDSRPEGERRDSLGGDVIQWSEGRVTGSGLPRELPLSFQVVRTYKVPKKPLSLVPKPLEPEKMRIEQVEAPGGPLPIHVIRTTGPLAFHVVAYMYVYGNDPVPHPFEFQLRGAWRELREGQRPTTLFLVSGPATRANAVEREGIALRWIVAAWQHYRSMCLVRNGAGSP